MPYLIDGHNVIAALPDISLEDEHDEAKLVIKLRAYFGHKRRKAIVVFDSGLPGGPAPALSSPTVHVVFAARHHSSADSIIRERLKGLSDAPNWTVVSSDHEVLRFARSRGAQVLTAQVFADLLNQPYGGALSEKPEALSAAEVEAWLEIFAELEEAQPPEAASPVDPRPAAAKAGVPGSPKPTPRATPLPEAKSTRSTRTIAEQMGVSLPSEAAARTRGRAKVAAVDSDKPEEITAEEVEAWLDVFHDLPESTIPPPKLRRRQAPKEEDAAPQAPVVRKDQGLTPDEVQVWMQEFSSPQEEQPAAAAATGKEKRPRSKLAKKRQNLARAEGEGKTELSPEDAELWQRLFGDGG